MGVSYMLYGFQFQNHFVFNQNIRSKSFLKGYSAVGYSDGNLSFSL